MGFVRVCESDTATTFRHVNDCQSEGQPVTINEYPRLCGGTFFTLVLQALRQRMKAREHYSGDSDGLSDPEVLVGLIRVINPDYADPGKENLKGTANNYKACKTSNSTYLPFDDEQVLSAFDSVVRTDYHRRVQILQ